MLRLLVFRVLQFLDVYSQLGLRLIVLLMLDYVFLDVLVVLYGIGIGNRREGLDDRRWPGERERDKDE